MEKIRQKFRGSSNIKTASIFVMNFDGIQFVELPTDFHKFYVKPPSFANPNLLIMNLVLRFGFNLIVSLTDICCGFEIGYFDSEPPCSNRSPGRNTIQILNSLDGSLIVWRRRRESMADLVALTALLEPPDPKHASRASLDNEASDTGVDEVFNCLITKSSRRNMC
ncbi:hypothetical protein L2E82_15498 [Cichorium intybus]|uniref:Uncharacterized protein n=1 Tax=Cichorium intybus TaxID=13427 RepID=A0ACB9F2K1_CICIN|nr:hypothetical protein L2E82_15498 [Cichorium intybus]